MPRGWMTIPRLRHYRLSVAEFSRSTPGLFLSPFTRCSLEAGAELTTLWRVSAVRTASLERLDWESERWDDWSTPPPPPPTPNHITHAHSLKRGSAGSEGMTGLRE